MTTAPTLTVVPAAPAPAPASGPSPAAVLPDLDRPGCAWYVVAPAQAGSHAA